MLLRWKLFKYILNNLIFFIKFLYRVILYNYDGLQFLIADELIGVKKTYNYI